MPIARATPIPPEDDIFGASGGASATDSAKRATGDLTEFLGGRDHPHPRGSLFDDIDVARDEAQPSPSPNMHPASGTLVDSNSVASVPQRVVSAIHSSCIYMGNGRCFLGTSSVLVRYKITPSVRSYSSSALCIRLCIVSFHRLSVVGCIDRP